MFKHLLICLLAIQITQQACSTGCLHCSTDDVCQLCDPTKNLLLTNGACVAVTLLANCEAYNLNSASSLGGDCILCDSAHYYNTSTKTCDDVTATIENCTAWSSATTCLSCASTHVLIGTTCELVTTVDNCDSYSNTTTCVSCNSGFTLNTVDNVCEPIVDTPVSNCIGYNEVTCDTCTSGFVFNPNVLYETTVITSS